MPTTMNQAMFDPEMDSITQARLYAKSLRDSTQKNIDEGKNGRMVGPYWIANDDRNDLLKQGMAGGLEYAGGQAAANLSTQRDAEFKTALANRPDMMMDQTTPGTPAVTQEFPGADAFGGEGSAPVTAEVTPEVLPTTKRVMKPYQQQQQEQIKWATDMAGLKHPMAQSLAAQGMKEAWDIPEKGMAREELAAARKDQLLLQSREAAERERVRLAEKADQNERDRVASMERVKERAHEAANLARIAAGLKPTPAPEIIKSDQGLFTLGRDGKLLPLMGNDGKQLMPPATATEKKLSVAEQKRETSRSDLRAKLVRAQQMLTENPDAAGWKTLLVPNQLLSRASTQGERMTRGASGELSAEKAHELYGSAFTGMEMKRAGKFLPEDGDSYDTLQDKFTNLLQILDATETKPIGPAKPATGADAIPLENGLTPAQEKRRQELKAKHGR